jgi:hypothetical protein
MSQWWVLFVLGFGVGLAIQIVFPFWSKSAALLPPIYLAKSVIRNVCKRGGDLLISAGLGVIVLIILVSGSH